MANQKWVKYKMGEIFQYKHFSQKWNKNENKIYAICQTFNLLKINQHVATVKRIPQENHRLPFYSSFISDFSHRVKTI